MVDTYKPTIKIMKLEPFILDSNPNLSNLRFINLIYEPINLSSNHVFWGESYDALIAHKNQEIKETI